MWEGKGGKMNETIIWILFFMAFLEMGTIIILFADLLTGSSKSRGKMWNGNLGKKTNKTKQRTIKQNRALHLFYYQLAELLNEHGLDMKAVLKEDVDIPWTTENVKNHLWRPLQEAYLNKKSTIQLETNEIDKIYNILCKMLGEKFGLHQEFPNMENYIQKQINLW